MSRRPVNTDNTTAILDYLANTAEKRPYVDHDLPCAWVGCLACYNDGKLVGEWVQGTDAGDFVPCDKPEHEEFWVFDLENYQGFLSGETSPEEAQRIAEALEDIDEDHLVPFGLWVANGSGDLDDYDDFLGQYRGVYRSLKDYAEEFLEDTGAFAGAPDLLRTYFDFDAYAHDLDCSGFWTAPAFGSTVYVFGE